MRLLDKTESNRWLRHPARQGAKNSPQEIVYYDSGRADYVGAARLIAGDPNTMSIATVVCTEAVFGDYWGEQQSNAADPHVGWSRFYDWRERNAARCRLYDFPGHKFEKGEAPLLVDIIEFVLLLGWDAMLEITPGRSLIAFSHDDRLEFLAGGRSRDTARKLGRLRGWRQASR